MDVVGEVLRAEDRIRRYVKETPLEHSPHLSELGGSSTYLKLENLQPTGSFKVRGAFNRLLALTPGQRDRGVVAASSGNHGLAVAFGAGVLGVKATVFVPKEASSTKVERIRRLGVEVRRHGTDVAVTEAYARAYAEEECLTYVSPYNDPLVIGGQGTIALELARQMDRLDVVLASVGGGGLISGIAGYAGSVLDGVEVVGCQPENSPVMAESVKAGRMLQMDSKPSLSDGTAGGIEPGSITFDLCRRYVDRYVTVSEGEIAEAMRLFIESEHTLIEGAAAVAVAAYLKTRDQYRGKNVVIVISGANVGLETLRTVL